MPGSRLVIRLKTLKNWYFIIGFALAAPGPVNNVIPANQVYRCSEYVKQCLNIIGKLLIITSVMIVTRPGKFGGPGQPDLAIIRLETVATQPPLVISTNPPAQDEPLWMAGHGDGLPLKISAGQCSRRDIRALPKPNVQTFYHNLSSFHGNSGSPIFNNNNQVVGIEVWGPDDYDIGTGTITGLFEAAMPAHLSKWGVGMRTDHMRWLIDTAATVTVMAWLPSDAKSSETLDCQITVSYDKTTIGDTNDAQPGKYMLFDVSQDLRKRAVRAIDLDSLLFKLNRIGTETRGVSRRLEYFVIKAANPNNDSQRFCMVYDPTPALMELSAGKKGNVRVDFPEEMLPSLIHDHE